MYVQRAVVPLFRSGCEIVSSVGPQSGIVLWTEDADTACDMMVTHGATPVTPPHTYLGRLRTGRVGDPNGIVISIMPNDEVPEFPRRDTEHLHERSKIRPSMFHCPGRLTFLVAIGSDRLSVGRSLVSSHGKDLSGDALGDGCINLAPIPEKSFLDHFNRQRVVLTD